MTRSPWPLLCLALTIQPAQVARVLDGDTFVLWTLGVTTEERVRLLGIDTPERGAPGFAEAAAFTRDWLARGPFALSTCRRDSFGRLLATVERDGEQLADALRQAGFDVHSRKEATQ